MQYQRDKFKEVNLLDNKPNQPGKLRTKNLVEVSDDSYEMYSTCSQIRFKTSLRNWSLCDYGDAYIFASGTATIKEAPDGATEAKTRIDARNKELMFKNSAPFIQCTSKINDTAPV